MTEDPVKSWRPGKNPECTFVARRVVQDEGATPKNAQSLIKLSLSTRGSMQKCRQANLFLDLAGCGSLHQLHAALLLHDSFKVRSQLDVRSKERHGRSGPHVGPRFRICGKVREHTLSSGVDRSGCLRCHSEVAFLVASQPQPTTLIWEDAHLRDMVLLSGWSCFLVENTSLCVLLLSILFPPSRLRVTEERLWMKGPSQNADFQAKHAGHGKWQPREHIQ